MCHKKMDGYKRPIGDIVTLLDLTPRDFQDGYFTPLDANRTWWLPNKGRRIRPFSMSIQEFPIRGPTGYGQRFVFDLKSVTCGDILFSTILQIQLSSWLDDTTILRIDSEAYKFNNPSAWFFANSLGSVIIEKASLEVNDQIIETIDGDFLNVHNKFFEDMNNQFGLATDGLGVSSLTQTAHPFPGQSDMICIPLPFFFQRFKLEEGFPLLACKEGSVRINITLRPFSECVRRLSGMRSSCDEVPLNTVEHFMSKGGPIEVKTQDKIPSFKQIKLVTYCAQTDGIIRQNILREPLEILMRNVSTFYFAEPLKYVVNKTSSDTIQVQLPLEANHPMEEILWFVRRKDVAGNNEWTNYSSVIQKELDPIYNPPGPLLVSASLQFNGVDIVSQDEKWFRQNTSFRHKGGYSAYSSYIYGYSFATNPGEHQPSGTANASRLQTVRLNLTVNGVAEWEVKVFVITLQWLRFQDGISNLMYKD